MRKLISTTELSAAAPDHFKSFGLLTAAPETDVASSAQYLSRERPRCAVALDQSVED